MGELKTTPGTNNIILVAPHGVPQDDINTGKIAEKIRQSLDCYAAINEKYRRPDKDKVPKEETDVKKLLVDCNHKGSINKAKITDQWFDKIYEYKKKIIGHGLVPGSHDKCFIFMIHGAENDNVKIVGGQHADVLLGIGRIQEGVDDKEDRSTATTETINNFIEHLKNEGLTAVEAKASKKHGRDIENRYAGHDINNLNQCFVERNEKGHLDPKIQSFQLEFKFTGFRQTGDDIVNTARRLAAAIGKLTGVVPIVDSELVKEDEKQPIEQDKVDKAVEHILNIYQDAFNSAVNSMVSVGDYLIDTFFNGNYTSASNPRNVAGDASIRQIHKQLREEIGSPSKSWVYNAIKVSVDSDRFKKEDFHTYGNLSISHRVKLAPLDYDEKKELAQLSFDEKWSVSALSKEIKAREFDKMPAHEQLVLLLASPKEFMEACEQNKFQKDLEGLEAEHQNKIKADADKEAKKIGMEIQKLKELKKQYEALVK